MTFNREKYEGYLDDVVYNPFTSEYHCEGYVASWSFHNIKDNPYSEGTFEWYEWIDGYLDADLDSNGSVSIMGKAKGQVRG